MLPRTMLRVGMEFIGIDEDSIDRILSFLGTTLEKFVVLSGDLDTLLCETKDGTSVHSPTAIFLGNFHLH